MAQQLSTEHSVIPQHTRTEDDRSEEDALRRIGLEAEELKQVAEPVVYGNGHGVHQTDRGNGDSDEATQAAKHHGAQRLLIL